MNSAAMQIWNRCLEDYLRPELNELSYKTWFVPAEAYLEGERDFILITPNKLSCEYLSQYAALIENALALSTGREFNLKIDVKSGEKLREEVIRQSLQHELPVAPQEERSDFFSSSASRDAKANYIPSRTPAPAIERSNPVLDFPPRNNSEAELKEGLVGQEKLSEPQPIEAVKSSETVDSSAVSLLNPNYTFDSFVVGPGNNFAYAASIAISSMQGGQDYNPLFLYGGSGLGKTHLMQAIGNEVKRKFPHKRIVYVQTEKFVNDFIQVIKSKHFDQFRRKYRMADLLLIDDIQFIEGKEQMQEEFFHTFNTLYENHKNIVLTCDQPPQTLSTLEERLKTRFSSGLIVDISPPDYETRIAILRQLSEQFGVKVPDDVNEFIARNISSNIRELEGAFKTLMAYCMIAGPIDLSLAKEALKSNIKPNEQRRIDAELIKQVVANFYNITTEDLLSKQRSQDIAWPRQIAMYLCRNSIDMTFSDIGQAFGGRNHATVIHAYDKIKESLQSDEQLKREIEELSERLST
ncbi:MAG: chromosomal replication initiator protein DnaA [Eubacteriales bacterium]|nr:chromosomal replication initiator protein DnaA [Eubacteriales bacterium]